MKKQRELAEQLMGAGNTDGTVEKMELPSKHTVKLEAEQKIKLTLGSTSRPVVKERAGSSKSVFDEIDNEKTEKGNKDSGKNGKPEGRLVLDEIMREEDEERERNNRKDYWLCVGIIVKVMSKALADKGYYKQKGIVRKVIDKYVGEIEMIESKHVLRVDQEELETVIPQIGGLVRIVNGAYRGSNARLLAVIQTTLVLKYKLRGEYMKAIDYEDISKIAE